MKNKNTINRKNKFYELIGRVTVGLTVWAITVYGFVKISIYILDNCCTTLK